MTENINDSESKMNKEENSINNQYQINNDKQIGDLIRRKREEKNLSLKVISQHTKIHIGLLESLEKNELHRLPSKTYVRGFIKATSKLLDLDQDEALALLDKSYTDIGPIKEKKIYHAPPPENSLNNQYSRKSIFSLNSFKSISVSYLASSFKFMAVVGFIITIGIALKNYIKAPGEDSKQKLPVVLSTIHQKVKTSPRPATIKESNKSEKVEAPPIQVNLIHDNKKEIATKSEIIIKDVKLNTVTSNEEPLVTDSSLTKEQYDEYLPQRFRVGVTKGVEVVFVNAVHGDSWITYKIGGKDIQKFVLRQGRTVFMRGENVRLFIGNIKNVKIFYNNQLLKLDTKTNMKNLVFPESSKATFMNPLFVFQKDGTVVTSDDYVKANHQEPKPSDTVPAHLRK